MKIKDHRADLTVQSVPNPENDSPATFLAKKRPPASIQYRRVTPRFFAVSSIRNGRTWYNRCNRANEYMNCVLINYPAAEERQWDAVVTRISLSLANSPPRLVANGAGQSHRHGCPKWNPFDRRR